MSPYTLSKGMIKQLEKRWKELDQPMFLFTLILNPYERLTRFGNDTNFNVFSLGSMFMEVRAHHVVNSSF